jgi:hypothetical protein
VLPPVRWACPDRGLALQGTITVLNGLPARRRPLVPEPIRSPVTMTSMPHPAQSSQVDAIGEDEEVMLGVDTHKDTHVAAVLTTMGALLDSNCFATTAAGYQQLLGWAQGWGGCGEPGWSAPAPTGRRWPATCGPRACRSSRSISRIRPPGADAARPTPSTPRPPPGWCLLVGRPRPPRPAMGRWRWRGCSSSLRTLRSSPPPRPSTSSRPYWCPPIQRCASRCPG